MSMSYEKALRVAMEAALEAGEILRQEFHRPGGPRGHHAHADADEEAEWIIRKRLLAAFPDYRYRGEETGSVTASDPHIWLVDPNDGTLAYLRGARGSAVSIGLLCAGTPVLGVVYAFVAPDDRGDLICWAEGQELTRNGTALRTTWDASRPGQAVILVSTHREHMIDALLECVKPYRYSANPSIAYRLALVAAGEGVAAVSWHSPGDWDYCAGHALIRAAGGLFLNEDGREITYAADGASKVRICFGGEPTVVRQLLRGNWNDIPSSQPPKSQSPAVFSFSYREPGVAIADPDLLSRAQGCLLGQVAGDALGQLVEFQSAENIRRKYTQGIHFLEDGGTWNTMAGQPTDDSELALLLARSILQEGKYVREKVAEAYAEWFHHMSPFDVGFTTAQALGSVPEPTIHSGREASLMSENASLTSQSNGSLMRISPLAIYGYRKPLDELWDLACRESSLTHPHPVCQQACALFVITIKEAIQLKHPPEVLYEHAMQVASQKNAEPELQQALRQAAVQPPDSEKNSGWVLVALQNVFYYLIHSNSIDDALVWTVMQGGDTDTNAAITGALLGAVYGRASIPFQWKQMVLSCRPHSLTGAQHPRPLRLWPIDLLNLAEMLLLCG